MAKFEFKQVLVIIALSYGLLFAFSAFGILGFIMNMLPVAGTVELGKASTIPVSGLIAVVVISFISTFMAVAINEGLENPKLWAIFVMLALFSAAIWVFAPQLLPKELQLMAAYAQTLFTGSMPAQALIMP